MIATGEGWTLYRGDCPAALKELADNSVDSVVTDPPYELAFMGKAWDRQGVAYNVDLWREVLRVLKPGGHLLAFGGTRTYHRMTVAIEDAGFEIRDCIQWLYGSGFPKSHNISKAIDKAAGAERNPMLTAPATPEAQRWEGFGTSLKPSHEPIVLARKPLAEPTIAAQVLATGTGALNVDACRVTGVKPLRVNSEGSERLFGLGSRLAVGETTQGRWPSNLVLSHSSLPVMRLHGNLPCSIIDTIRRCYYGYSRVSELRARGGNDALQTAVGSKVLQSRMQGGIHQDQTNTRASGNNVPCVRQEVHCAGGVDTGGETEVLQSGVSFSLSTDSDGRTRGQMGEGSHLGDAGQDFENENGARCIAKGRKPSELEGRAARTGWICERSYSNVARTGSDDGSPDATERGVYPGASSKYGDEDRQTTEANGVSPSHQRGQDGQSPRKSGDCRAFKAQPGTPPNRERTSDSARDEPPLDVLAVDVPAEWFQYFELTGEDLGCVKVGRKRVETGTAVRHNSGGNTFGGDNPKPPMGDMTYADADGLEEIDDWLCEDGCPVKALDEQAGERKTGSGQKKVNRAVNFAGGGWKAQDDYYQGDTGSASRFFPVFAYEADDFVPFRYVSKASRREREAGLEGMEARRGGAEQFDSRWKDGAGDLRQPVVKNSHPTVKPLALMAWLVRLVCPPGGVVLDPFTGSGTTGCAALREGFSFIGVEREVEYIEIARRRLEYTLSQQPAATQARLAV